MEDPSNEKAAAICLKAMNEPSPATIDHNNNNNNSSSGGQENGKVVGKLTAESIPLAHWPLQASITTVNLTDSASSSYFLMHAPLDLISSSATLSQSSE